MSENVIEQFADDLRGRSDMQTYAEVADELQAATRPEQFMPPLRDWPKGAEWCSICAEGFTCFWRQTPKLSGSTWNFGIKVGLFGRVKQVEIPLGIDWRTLKVSRSQMEVYENG